MRGGPRVMDRPQRPLRVSNSPREPADGLLGQNLIKTYVRVRRHSGRRELATKYTITQKRTQKAQEPNPKHVRVHHQTGRRELVRKYHHAKTYVKGSRTKSETRTSLSPHWKTRTCQKIPSRKNTQEPNPKPQTQYHE